MEAIKMPRSGESGGPNFIGSPREFMRSLGPREQDDLYGDVVDRMKSILGAEAGLVAAHEALTYYWEREDTMRLDGLDHFKSLVIDKANKVGISEKRDPGTAHLFERAKQCFLFTHSVRPDDLVFLKQPTQTKEPTRIIAVGTVESDYRYDPLHPLGRHLRSVLWRPVTEQVFEADNSASNKLLHTRRVLVQLGTKKYAGLARELCALFGIDLARLNTRRPNAWLVTSERATELLEADVLALELDRLDDLRRYRDLSQMAAHVRAMYLRPGEPEPQVSTPEEVVEHDQQQFLDRNFVDHLKMHLEHVHAVDPLWLLRACLVDDLEAKDAIKQTRVQVTWKVKSILENLRRLGQTNWDDAKVQRVKRELKEIARKFANDGGENE